MTVNPILKIIRAKKIGVLIRDARLNTDRSVEDCAQAMGISTDELTAMELGERPPTLPELEIFAYYLEIPLDHFWENKVLDDHGNEKVIDPIEIKQSRQNAIGSLIRKARIEAVLSVEELADRAGMAPEVLESYEQGETAVPLPELELLTQVLNQRLANFDDQDGQVGNWFTEQRYMREFLGLPKELLDFISKPVNRPYLYLAIKLSELKTERLRALAEGLLEITL